MAAECSGENGRAVYLQAFQKCRPRDGLHTDIGRASPPIEPSPRLESAAADQTKEWSESNIQLHLFCKKEAKSSEPDSLGQNDQFFEPLTPVFIIGHPSVDLPVLHDRPWRHPITTDRTTPGAVRITEYTLPPEERRWRFPSLMATSPLST